MTAARFFAAEPPLGWEVIVDITIRENHELTATVSEHAIQNGSDTADHTRIKRPRISLEVGVTDTPISAPSTQGDGVKRVEQELFRYQAVRVNDKGIAEGGAVTAVAGRVLSAPLYRVQRVWEALEERFSLRKRISVESAILTRPDMMIVRLGGVIEQVGRATFTVDLQQIAFDSVATVAALPPKPKAPSGKPKVDRGNKPPVPRPADDPNESLAFQASNLMSTEPPNMSVAP